MPFLLSQSFLRLPKKAGQFDRIGLQNGDGTPDLLSLFLGIIVSMVVSGGKHSLFYFPHFLQREID